MNCASPAPLTLVEHLYEVAIEPASYERLLDHWEEILRPSLEADASPDEVEAGLAQMRTHLERADRVLARTMQAPPEETAAAAVGAIRHAASMAVDAKGALVAVNAAAGQTLGVMPGARLSSLPLEPGEADRLAKAAQALLRSNASGTQVLCLRALGSGRLIVLHMRLHRPPSEAAFVLCITSEICWPAGFAEEMRSSFALSDAEIGILRQLTEGYALGDIAELRGRSIETVRVQVKSILSKTRLRSQVELVRLSLSVVETLQDADGPSRAEPARPAPVPLRRLRLKDGRQIEYIFLGDDAGRPVLFLPIDLGFTRLTPAAEDEARRRGLKLVVPIRAGYGGSSPHPETAAFFPAMIRDHLDLLDHLRLDRLPILTQGDDSLLAFQLQAAAPGRFSALVCCGGVLPMTAEQLQRMDKWHRFILTGAKYTPKMLSFLVKAGAALARRYGKQSFLQSIYAGSAADSATFAMPDVAETLITSSDVMLSETHSGHEAFAREQIAKFAADWTEPLQAAQRAVERGRMSVHFFNGEQDPQVGPLTLEDYFRDHPWIDYRIYPDAGQLVLYLKWRDVMERLDALA